MEEPRSEARATADERDEPPDFDSLTPPDELVRGERTRDDFFDAVLQLDTPATVDDVADLADHGTDAAREYLDWFERMGIVTRVTDAPVTYQLNRGYLAWRRIHRLRETYTTDELLEFLETETERDRRYGDEFGVASPSDVSLTEHATASERSIEEVWEAVSNWKTTRRRIALLEGALAAETDDSSDSRRSIA
jgi:hypothetical protein